MYSTAFGWIPDVSSDHVVIDTKQSVVDCLSSCSRHVLSFPQEKCYGAYYAYGGIKANKTDARSCAIFVNLPPGTTYKAVAAESPPYHPLTPCLGSSDFILLFLNSFHSFVYAVRCMRAHRAYLVTSELASICDYTYICP